MRMIMGQYQLPLFPAGNTIVTRDLSFEQREGKISYFYGLLPIFSHDKDDVATFRMITSQFYVNGYVKQSEIVNAFGVTKISVKRSVALYRIKGVKGFYEPRKTRGAVVLTPTVLTTIQDLIDKDIGIKEIAKQLNLKHDTLSKAVKAGKLHLSAKKKRL